MPQPKPRKVGRPKLPKGDAKGRIVPIRFNANDLKRIESAAKANKQTVSEWVRGPCGYRIRGLRFKMPTIEDQVLELLAAERGLSKSEIQPEDTLAQDLGMDGDDAEYFFRSFAKKFNVDIELLWLNWKHHFSSEVSFLPFTTRKDPVTVRELVDSAVAGRWVKTY